MASACQGHGSLPSSRTTPTVLVIVPHGLPIDVEHNIIGVFGGQHYRRGACAIPTVDTHGGKVMQPLCQRG